MRKVIGVLVGIVLANLLIFGWEYVLPLLPFGSFEVTPTDDAEFVTALPLAAQLWIAAGWGLGAASCCRCR